MPSIFNQVKDIMSTINGGKERDLVGNSSLDSKIDSLSNYSIVDPNKRNSYFQLYKDTLYSNKKVSNNDIIDNITKALEGTYASQKRIAMYDEVRAIFRQLPLLMRAVRIYVDNILSPDEITKFSLQVVANTDDEDEEDSKYDTIIDEYKNIIKSVKLEDIVDNLITNTLIEGDRFYEITTVKSDFVHTAKMSNIQLKEEKYKFRPDNSKEIREMTVYFEDTPNIDFNYYGNSLIKENEFNDGINYIMEDVYKLVDPNNPNNNYIGPTKTVTFVPKSTNEDNPDAQDVLGYVNDITGTDDKNSSIANEDVPDSPKEVLDFVNNITNKNDDGVRTITFTPKQDTPVKGLKNTIIPTYKLRLVDHNPRNIVIIRQKKWIMGYLYVDVVNSTQGVSNSAMNRPFDDELSSATELIDKLYKSVLNYLKSKSVDEIPDDLKDTITNILKNHMNGDVVIRFIPIENIQHFKINSEEFDPYGESYFYNILPMIKMYLSKLLASTLYALARAGRHLLIEVDCTNEHDARNRIESVRRALKKREITGDDLNSLETVAKHLTTFDDIYVPSKDGKKFVNIDTLDLGSAEDKDSENDKLLKNILTGIEIPPSLLGIEEYTNSRNTLSQESIVFARSIIRLQKLFSDQLTSFVQKIYVLMHKKSHTIDPNYEEVRITFPAPQGILSSSSVEILSNQQNAVNIWTQLGFTPKDAKQKVLPWINWNKVDTKAFSQPQQQPGMGGMDMGMGGMGDMGMGDMGGGMDMGMVDAGGMGDMSALGGDMGGGMDMSGGAGMTPSQALGGSSVAGDLSAMGIQ